MLFNNRCKKLATNPTWETASHLVAACVSNRLASGGRVIALAFTLLCVTGCGNSLADPQEDADKSSSAEAGDQASSVDVANRVDGPSVDDAANKDADTNRELVALELADQAGLLKRVAEAEAEVVVVDIWSTSCAPCMKEFPHLVDLSREYPERVKCISFNVDYTGSKKHSPESLIDKAQQFLTSKQAATVDNFLSTEPDMDILEKFELDSIPSILIYGSDGQLVAAMTDSNSGEDGLSYQGDVIPVIEQLLNK